MVDRFEQWRFRNNDGIIAENDIELFGDLKGRQTITTEHGLGSVGTFGAPVMTRVTIDGTIIKTIKVDLDGYTVKGTQAKDSIGLQLGSLPSYIGRYIIARDGVCFRIEMICTVTPTEETATIEGDIDLGFDGVGTMYQNDGVAIDDIKINAGTLVTGQMVVNNVPALTDLDYIYLIEGATNGSTGEYSGGQFVIKMYGHPIRT